MATIPSQRSADLAHKARSLFASLAIQKVMELGPLVRSRMQWLVDQSTNAREMQLRRDAWLDFQKQEAAWLRGCAIALQGAKSSQSAPLKHIGGELSFELLGDDVVENQIISSRLALRVLDKVTWELNDLRLRIQSLEGRGDLEPTDVLRPETFARIVVEQWALHGQSQQSWTLVQDSIQAHLAEHLVAAYRSANELLIAQGVMPEIDRRSMVKRTAEGAPGSFASSKFTSGSDFADNAQEHLTTRPDGTSSRPGSGGRGGSGAGGSGGGGSRSDSGSRTGPGGASTGPASAGFQGKGGNSHPAHAGTATGLQDETRLLTSTTPLARVKMRAQGVMGQLRRLLSDKVSGYDDTRPQVPSTPLVKELVAQQQFQATQQNSNFEPTDGRYEAVHVERAANQVRQRSADLKKVATSTSEKATIEIVALMFQSILAEERISAAVRVWFARLQMPVLRVALSEPEFFGSLQHPARRLIDRMGSCVLGFDAAVSGSVIEVEIKRVVQVIEQYPETGRRVFQLVYDEFQKFLSKFLTGHGTALRVVSVAQQIEQKETMAIQYTIEMRSMLGNMPVRDIVREFLFKIWAEVLAITAIKSGPQHQDTIQFKQAAADLVWAASAKPNRNDRARVIQALPTLLQRLRMGMSLLGLADAVQDQHIKSISSILADAFMSKTEAIDQSHIDAMSKRLANLEDYLSEEDVGDLPIDAENIELLLGIDTTGIQIITEGGSEPTEAMRAWAAELQQGTWLTLDHNGHVDRVQFAWRSDRGQLYLFATPDNRSFLFQLRRAAAYLQAGLLAPIEEEALTVRATRDALSRLDANPERLLN